MKNPSDYKPRRVTVDVQQATLLAAIETLAIAIFNEWQKNFSEPKNWTTISDEDRLMYRGVATGIIIEEPGNPYREFEDYAPRLKEKQARKKATQE